MFLPSRGNISFRLVKKTLQKGKAMLDDKEVIYTTLEYLNKRLMCINRKIDLALKASQDPST